MANLKQPNEQVKSIKYQNLISKHEKKIDLARQKMVKFKDNSERCKKYLEQIQHSQKRLQYYSYKQHDLFSVCEDYEIEAVVNRDMVDFHLKHLFPDKAYVSTMLSSGFQVSRRMMDIQTLRQKAPHLLSFDMDAYVSPVSFAHSRKETLSDGTEVVHKGVCKETAISTQAIIIDLDYRDTIFAGLFAEDLYETMIEEGAFSLVGEPSYVVVSSEHRGIQMVYLLEAPYFTRFQTKNILKYEETVRKLIDHFSRYGADKATADIAHYFRLPCSFNSKSGAHGFLLYWERLRDDEYEVTRYPFSHFVQAMGEKKRHQTTSPKVQPSKKSKACSLPPATNRSNLYTLAYNRIRDIKRILELRQYDTEGMRNTILRIYASQFMLLCEYDAEELKQELYALNDLFLVPQKEREVNAVVNSTLRKKYKYSDDTICSLLAITEEERMQLQVIGHAQGNEEKRESRRVYKSKKRRNEQGELISHTKRAERNEKIIALRDQGWTNQEVADELGVSTRTVRGVYNSWQRIAG